MLFGPPFRPSLALSVGQDPDPVPLVRGSNIGRAQHSPFRIEPERGQVSKHPPKSPNSESWGVFHAHETGSNLANDTGHVGPQPGAFAVDPGSLACNADVLAREAARNHVNSSAPRPPVEGCHVVPNREGRQRAFVLPCGQDCDGVGVSLDCTDGAPSEQVACEYAATSACEKSQLIHSRGTGRMRAWSMGSWGQATGSVGSCSGWSSVSMGRQAYAWPPMR